MAKIEIDSHDVDGFENAFREMRAGDAIVYHVGRSLWGVNGTYAYYLFEAGLVQLAQRRIKDKDGYFQYLAIRTKKHRAEPMRLPKNYARTKSFG